MVPQRWTTNASCRSLKPKLLFSWERWVGGSASDEGSWAYDWTPIQRPLFKDLWLPRIIQLTIFVNQTVHRQEVTVLRADLILYKQANVRAAIVFVISRRSLCSEFEINRLSNSMLSLIIARSVAVHALAAYIEEGSDTASGGKTFSCSTVINKFLQLKI